MIANIDNKIKYATDSRKVIPGNIFIAIKGNTVDGHRYIMDAIMNGAKRIVAEEPGNYGDIDTLLVDNTEEFAKNVIANEYANDFKYMKLIGVTGTNGKTSTCYYTYQLLKMLGNKPAYIGTLGYIFEEEFEHLNNTTPDTVTIYNLLESLKAKGCTHVVMELSSHALDTDRIAGLKFDIGAFTNLTQDHLDYHKDMQSYLNAKLKIFRHLKKDAHMIVNYDDPYAEYFKKDEFAIYNADHITEGVGMNPDSLYRILAADCEPGHTKIKFSDNVYYDREIETNFTFEYNVYNYMMAYAILRTLGYKYEEIKDATEIIHPAKGRAEIIDVGNAHAIIDYAHTPDAVKKMCESTKTLLGDKGKVITIIGCGGDRDRTKRPIMGKLACDNSDHVIFTDDNPRTEDPKNIMNDIINGLDNTNYEIEHNRTKAINKGLEMLNENDVLLILGKGHENYQIIGKEKIHYDDHEVVEKWKNLNIKVLERILDNKKTIPKE